MDLEPQDNDDDEGYSTQDDEIPMDQIKEVDYQTEDTEEFEEEYGDETDTPEDHWVTNKKNPSTVRVLKNGDVLVAFKQ